MSNSVYVNLFSEQIWCRKCHRPIVNGSVVVEASKFVDVDGKEAGLFHPQCFICCTCNELLADLIYCRDSHGRLLCVRHYDETFLSRCPTCDQVSSTVIMCQYFYCVVLNPFETERPL